MYPIYKTYTNLYGVNKEINSDTHMMVKNEDGTYTIIARPIPTKYNCCKCNNTILSHIYNK